MRKLCCKCLLVCCVQAKHRARWPHVSAFCPLERVSVSEFERANKYDEEVPRKEVDKLVSGSASLHKQHPSVLVVGCVCVLLLGCNNSTPHICGCPWKCALPGCTDGSSWDCG